MCGQLDFNSTLQNLVFCRGGEKALIVVSMARMCNANYTGLMRAGNVTKVNVFRTCLRSKQTLKHELALGRTKQYLVFVIRVYLQNAPQRQKNASSLPQEINRATNKSRVHREIMYKRGFYKLK